MWLHLRCVTHGVLLAAPSCRAWWGWGVEVIVTQILILNIMLSCVCITIPTYGA
jgi:hypothetical protein